MRCPPRAKRLPLQGEPLYVIAQARRGRGNPKEYVIARPRQWPWQSPVSPCIRLPRRACALLAMTQNGRRRTLLAMTYGGAVHESPSLERGAFYCRKRRLSLAALAAAEVGGLQQICFKGEAQAFLLALTLERQLDQPVEQLRIVHTERLPEIERQ